jgi:hypothetical protein
MPEQENGKEMAPVLPTFFYFATLNCPVSKVIPSGICSVCKGWEGAF